MRITNFFFAIFALFLASCASSSQETAGANGGGDVVPTAASAGSQEELVQQVGDRVFFDFDSSAVRPDARATLDRLAIWMRSNPGARILIEGHADERGTREYNLALGARRANSVQNYLVASGIQPARLRTVSYGEERPAVIGSNELAWAQNRRAVFIVQ